MNFYIKFLEKLRKKKDKEIQLPIFIDTVLPAPIEKEFEKKDTVVIIENF
jgi:hypothetical protein